MKVLLVDQIAVINYKYTFSLANALRSMGNDVELVIDAKKNEGACECRCFNKFCTTRKDLGKIRKVVNYLVSLLFILRKAKCEKFELVHLQWVQFSPMDYLFIKVLKRNGKKIVMTVHDILPFNERKYDLFFHKKIYRMCNQIIVQARTNVDRFNKIFPEDSKKLNFVPHGHFLKFAENCPMESARKILGIPEQKMVFLFFGQIKKVKGVGILLESFGKLLRAFPNVYLVVAANIWKDDFGPYQKIIDDVGLTKENLKLDIRFVPDNEIPFYYSACDVAVLPYIDVYQSGVIQLAYAYKKAVVATAIPAFIEIVEHGKTGLLCKPNDVDSLYSALCEAVKNAADLNEWGNAGYKKIEKMYSWEKIAKQVSEIYVK